MSIQIAKVLVPPPVAIPRGAEWASELAATLARVGQQIWRALEAIGRARAQRALRGLAGRHPDRPEFAMALREAMNQAAMHRDSQN